MLIDEDDDWTESRRHMVLRDASFIHHDCGRHSTGTVSASKIIPKERIFSIHPQRSLQGGFPVGFCPACQCTNKSSSIPVMTFDPKTSTIFDN
jgi:hypothetical protein